MAWKIVYFTSISGENPVSRFIDSCAKKQQIKILRILKHLEEYGLGGVIPHLKKLSGTPFWEIRILGKDNIRIIYVVEAKKMIVLLHGFFKKTPKTLKKEIEICYQRYKELKQFLTR
ncbi:type II toxin-antitoxin system RelE/ParE family toxin [Candidatus Shapirobacteria bacterium]|nr:type II toxin-antitoxin system RelE/ParE family toxin [Candidatus Shapirobacteria bacterium]